MKKIITLIIVYLAFQTIGFAQDEAIQKFLMRVDTTSDLRAKVDLLAAARFWSSAPDSSFAFAQRGFKLAQAINYKAGEVKCQYVLSLSSWAMGDFETAIKLAHNVGEYAVIKRDTNLLTNANGVLGNSYRDQGDYIEALRLIFRNIENTESTKYIWPITYDFIASCYLGLEKYDSALFYLDKSKNMVGGIENVGGWPLLIRGRTLEKLNNDSLALHFYKLSIKGMEGNNKNLAGAFNSLATLYNRKERIDSAIYYANKGLRTADEGNFNKEKADAYLILSTIYEKINTEEAYKNLKLANAAKDSLFSQEKQRRIASFRFNEELRQQEIKAAELRQKSKIRTNKFLGSTFTFLIIAIFLFIIYRRKQKAKQKIEHAYDQLKSTQSQLIQAEKMASLGELTAGIAHEIQNPLNFVNNFSEVSNELIVEIEEERAKNPESRDENLVSEILSDIKQNLEKINHHGKRAGDIVKGMLQHSRTSSGVKEPTDINALADEYLRLAYHGLRAKDKSFNADFKTEFDPELPKINVIPQDIGRVLLNLINNAFYAAPLPPEGGFKDPNYIHKPTVTVGTSYLPPSGGMRGACLISVKDNGPGIPPHIIDKIFQPFFTTKPSGEGTGLGLSLSYDIVKAHGGELRVETEEGIGSEFIIMIPISENSGI
jgi:two-component system, NtrC family, sensor kinase